MMQIVENAEQPTSPEERVRLREVYDAHLILWDSSITGLAWRNLALLLTIYLKLFFSEAPGGRITVSSGPHPNPARVEYLSTLAPGRMVHLTENVLWKLFHTAGYVDYDDMVESKQDRNLMAMGLFRLSRYQFRLLLADITNELNKRTVLSAYPNEFSTARLYLHGHWKLVLLNWDLGILPHLYSDEPKLGPEPRRLRPTFQGLPRLLQRAFNTRPGSQNGTLIGPKAPLTDEPRNTKNDPHKVQASKQVSLDPDRIDVPMSTWNQSIAGFQIGPTPILESIQEEETYDEEEIEETLRLESANFPEPQVVYRHTSLEVDNFRRWSNSFRDSSSSTILDRSNRASIDIGELSRSDLQEQLSQAEDLYIEDFSNRTLGARSHQSTLSTHHSFVTARTRLTVQRFSHNTYRSSIATFLSFEATQSLQENPMARGPYWNMLKERDILPEPMMETDWSGRGQHVEFSEEERDSIPLQVEKLLGETRNARVESVRCKRVRLVRKLMRCTKSRGVKREDALREVQSLYRVQHSHIVRLVGTYVVAKDLAILTYPCAEWNLAEFMELTRTATDAAVERASLHQFFTCLAKVLDFMHSYPLKHMDIKPQNLLVRDIRGSTVNDADPYKIYFTDFGISRSYESVEEAETENPTSFTRTYAALEVIWQESRGLSVDVFSLGCVYAEMLATLLDACSEPMETTGMKEPTTNWNALLVARRNANQRLLPYHLANTNVCTWLSKLPIHDPELDTIRIHTIKMLDTDSSKRPSARQIADDPRLPFACLSCTLRTGPEDFEVAEPLTPLHEYPQAHTSIEVPKTP